MNQPLEPGSPLRNRDNSEQPKAGLVVYSQSGGNADAQRRATLSMDDSERPADERLGRFFEDCGGDGSISLGVWRSDGLTPPQTYVFRQPFVLIGSSRECDLTLPDTAVKSRHIYLQLIAGRWLCVDLFGMSNPSAENQTATPSAWFDPGAELQVGPYSVRFAGPEASEQPRPPSIELPAVDLELINARDDASGKQSRRISAPVTLIGASPQCGLWMRDQSVSKVHASLVLTPHGLWVVDLLGNNGVLVDERRTYWKRLSDGSVLQVGRFAFRARMGTLARRSSQKMTKRPQRRQTPSAPSAPTPPARVSDDSVMALIGHLAEMQSQFFEHSRMQMQMMAEMLQHLGRSQQASVRKDLARIDELDREMRELKAQLVDAQSARTTEAATPQPASRVAESIIENAASRESERTPAATDAVPPRSAAAEARATPAQDPVDGRTAKDGTAPRHRPAAAPSFPKSGSHVPSDAPVRRLTERMAHLAKERNSRWRRVLNALGRKSEDK